MKQKVISGLLSISMLLSMMAGFSGCKKSGFGTTAVVAGNGAEIGNINKDGWKLSIPKNAFDKDVKISVIKVESGEEYDASKDSFLVLPIDIGVEGMESVRLKEPVKITMKLDKKKLPNNESFDRTVMAYWNGSEWEPIFPDPVRLSEGYLEFETWHFSSYSGKLMTREEQIKLFAYQMAVDTVSTEVQDPTYIEKVKTVCYDYFDGIGVYSTEIREAILDRVLDMGMAPESRALAATGDIAALTKKCGEIFAQSTIDMIQENPLVKESLLESLNNLGTLIQGTEALKKGDYKTAFVELSDFSAVMLGGATGSALSVIKSVGELSKAAVEQGIMEWKDYEFECAYKIYAGLAKKGTYGYTLNPGDWETLRIQMGGYYNRLLSERKEAWRRLHGKDKLTNAEIRVLESYAEADLKEQLDKRLENENRIKAKAAEYEKIIQSFKSTSLLNRYEFGYKYYMTIDDRLKSLFTIRQVILKMVGGDISVFGDEKKREDNLSFAIAMWLSSGNNRTKFYDWMREQGYLKKSGDKTEGYWKLVRSFENKYKKSESDSAYSSSWSGGKGSYKYRCEVKYDGVSYTGITHKSCKGEFVENIGTSSTPKSMYIGGEQVQIDLKITAKTSSNICFHLGATLGATITAVNKDDPFTNYGTDISLYDITEKITKSYIQTGKNDKNTGYWGQSAKVGGQMPSGSANGDKVYILIGMSGGNNSITTAYEYVWVKN